MCFYSVDAYKEAVQYLFRHKNINKLLIFRHVFASMSGVYVRSIQDEHLASQYIQCSLPKLKKVSYLWTCF